MRQIFKKTRQRNKRATIEQTGLSTPVRTFRFHYRFNDATTTKKTPSLGRTESYLKPHTQTLSHARNENRQFARGTAFNALQCSRVSRCMFHTGHWRIPSNRRSIVPSIISMRPRCAWGSLSKLNLYHKQCSAAVSALCNCQNWVLCIIFCVCYIHIHRWGRALRIICAHRMVSMPETRLVLLARPFLSHLFRLDRWSAVAGNSAAQPQRLESHASTCELEGDTPVNAMKWKFGPCMCGAKCVTVPIMQLQVMQHMVESYISTSAWFGNFVLGNILFSVFSSSTIYQYTYIIYESSVLYIWNMHCS